MKYIISFFTLILALGMQAQYTVQVDPISGLYGVKDNSGKTIIPFTYAYLEQGADNQFIANTCDSKDLICSEGVIDINQKTIIPFEYGMIVYFKGYYRLMKGCVFNDVTLTCLGGTVGFANTSGQTVIPCMYDNTISEDVWIEFFSNIDQRQFSPNHSEGLFNVRQNGKWGYIDTNNNIIIPFQYEYASTFYLDSAEVTLNGIDFFIDKKGRCIKNCPDELNTSSVSNLSDQTANYEYAINEMMQLYVDDYDKYAGDEFKKRENQMYDRVADKMIQVINYGSADQKRVMSYMYFLILYNRAKNEKFVSLANPYLQKARKFSEPYTASDFPIKFVYKGNNRQYTYENYQGSFASYMVLLAECEYLTKAPNATNDIRRAIQLTDNPFQKTVMTGYLIDYKQQLKEYDQEILNVSSDLLAQYLKLNENERYRMDTLKLWSGNEPAAVEAGFTERSSEKIPLQFYVSGYQNYQTLGRTESAEYFMKKAYEGGHEETEFLYSYAALLKSKGDLTTANKIADKLAIRTSASDCGALQRIAELYASLDNMNAAKEYKTKADDCSAEALKAQKKAEKQRNRSSSSSYSYDRVNGGIYMGIDVLPLCRIDGTKRDFGFKVDLIGRHIGHEFGYSIQNNNRDNLWDLSSNPDIDAGANEKVYWNGYVAMYSLKFYKEDDESAFFFGPTFRYRYKDFGKMDTTIVSTDFTNVQFVPFHPIETQYELLLNYGVQTVKPGFAGEFYFGIGPKYSVFKEDSPYYNSPDWTINHSMLEYRKSSRWGLGMRMGFTIGIKIF